MTKENPSSTEMVTMDHLSIPDVISGINTEIEKMKDIENASSRYKTNLDLKPFGNLKDIKNVEDLIKAYSYITNKAKAYDEAATELQLKDIKPFKEGGYGVEEWKADITLQIKVLTHSDRLKELQKLKKEAESFISQEDKKKMFLNKILTTIQPGQ